MVSSKLTLVLALQTCLCWSLHAVAEEKLTIATYHITGMLEHKQDHLPFNRVLNLLAERLPVKVEYRFLHPQRAANTFRSSDTSCLFPGSLTLYEGVPGILESEPLQTARAHFMGVEMVTAERILDKSQPALRIGFQRGNSFGRTIHKLSHHRLVPLNTGADTRELINRKRIDVYLGYLPDALPIINADPEQPLQYNDATLYYTQNDSILCHDTPRSRVLIEAINEEIQHMKQSGELQSILKLLEAGAEKR